jgi:3D (Asp-Asp-Asp) domain-containing protein
VFLPWHAACKLRVVSIGLPALVIVAALLPQRAPAHKPPKAHKLMRMTATAYCDKGLTDGGIQAQRGVAAADPRLLPLGSRIRVTGVGAKPQTYLVADTGAAVKGRRIDIFIPSCRAAKRFGRKPVVVRLLSSPKRR